MKTVVRTKPRHIQKNSQKTQAHNTHGQLLFLGAVLTGCALLAPSPKSPTTQILKQIKLGTIDVSDIIVTEYPNYIVISCRGIMCPKWHPLDYPHTRDFVYCKKTNMCAFGGLTAEGMEKIASNLELELGSEVFEEHGPNGLFSLETPPLKIEWWLPDAFKDILAVIKNVVREC
jgi:hypothetical protein